MAESTTLERRATYSEEKLAQFRREVLSAVPQLAECGRLSIYTTGSFGRREAGSYSDLDLFFVYNGERSDVSNINKTLIDADLIRLCESLGYPPFSGDGVYLKIHTVDDLAKKIGHQREDAENIFTARMLLILESTPLHNETTYDQAITACVGEYYRDFEDHSTSFHPVFLTNDIIRFWKTLCLNYESARTGAIEVNKPKHRLKNFKLKFSRMMTCYSMLACLCDRAESDSPDKLTALVRMTPIQRIERICQKHSLRELYGSLLSEYEWFLTETDREKASALAWISENKGDAFRRAATFGDLVFRLLQTVAEETGGEPPLPGGMMKQLKVFYSIYVPVGPIRTTLDAIRLFARPQTKHPAHITIRGPYSDYRDPRVWSATVRGQFVEVGGVGTFFGPDQNTVFLRADAQAIHSVWDKPDYPGYNPHLSIYDGESRDFAESLRAILAQKDPRFSFTASGIEPMVSGNGPAPLITWYEPTELAPYLGVPPTRDELEVADETTRLSWIEELADSLVFSACRI